VGGVKDMKKRRNKSLKTEKGANGVIHRNTLESRELLRHVRNAMRITAELNTLVTDDFNQVRSIFSKLIGKKVDETFMIIPPFFTNNGHNIQIGKNVFVNYACSFMDTGSITIEDGVLIGPKVNLVTGGHPLSPSERRKQIIYKPILIKKNAWIGTAATIMPGVTIGENSVVAAGSVVTKNVPPNCLVVGVPAKVSKKLKEIKNKKT
jgi:acetyltransferase-like isoleucine patch superfamily enzyme